MRFSIVSTATLVALLPNLALSDDITADQIIQIDPRTKDCNSPLNPPGPGECATAADAAKALAGGSLSSKSTTAGEKAAVLSIMLFESAGFKYNRNKFPGNPGQGTRAMMMTDNIIKYADDLVQNKFLDQSVVEAAKSKAASDKGKAVLDIVLKEPKLDFNAAVWYYFKTCSPEVKAGVQSGQESGWNTYITSCVKTTATDDRKKLWSAAMQVFSGKSNTPAPPSLAPAASSAGPAASIPPASSGAASSAPNNNPAASANPAPVQSGNANEPASSAAAQQPPAGAGAGPAQTSTDIVSSAQLMTATATTLLTQTSPAAAAGASQNAGSSGSAAGNSSTGGSTTCSGAGALVCSPDGGQFGLCDGEVVRAWQPVSQGTKCSGGQIGYV